MFDLVPTSPPSLHVHAGLHEGCVFDEAVGPAVAAMGASWWDGGSLDALAGRGFASPGGVLSVGVMGTRLLWNR